MTDCLRLPEMVQDVEYEGSEVWMYAFYESNELFVNVTKIASYRNLRRWKWMWGAPKDANIQLILACRTEEEVSVAAQLIAAALDTPLVPYPDSWDF